LLDIMPLANNLLGVPWIFVRSFQFLSRLHRLSGLTVACAKRSGLLKAWLASIAFS